jgi:hypothetical protein
MHLFSAMLLAVIAVNVLVFLLAVANVFNDRKRDHEL